MHIDLPHGQWVEFRDIEKLTNGQRKPFLRAIASLPKDAKGVPDPSAADGDQILGVGEALLVALVDSWSFGPLPSEDPAALDNLIATDYDLLQCEAGNLLPEMMKNMGEPDPPVPSTPSRKR